MHWRNFSCITDNLEEKLVCDGAKTEISCSGDEEVLSIRPGTYYGPANKHVCNDYSNSEEQNCIDVEVHSDIAELLVMKII